ncbi:Phytochrome-like protein cph2 [compost metagenome]
MIVTRGIPNELLSVGSKEQGLLYLDYLSNIDSKDYICCVVKVNKQGYMHSYSAISRVIANLTAIEGVNTFNWFYGNYLLIAKKDVLTNGLMLWLHSKLTDTLLVEENSEQLIRLGVIPVGTEINKDDLCTKLNFLSKTMTNSSNNIIVWDSDISARYDRMLFVEKNTKRAMLKDDFLVYYQPIYNVSEQRFDRIEALARLQAADGSLIGPLEFLPVVKGKGKLLKFGEFVIDSVCKFIKVNNITQRVYINLSSDHFVNNDLVNYTMRCVKKYCISPTLLGFELLEDDNIIITPELIIELNRLQSLGIRCAFDDFGTGYTSLAYIGKLGLNDLKISRDLIKLLDKDVRAITIIKALRQLADMYDLDITAEGVESKDVAEKLIAEGVNHIQGFYYAIPLSARDYILKYK